MVIPSIPWLILLLMVNVSVLVSDGTAILDAIAVIFLGFETIRIRKGGSYDSFPKSTSPPRQFVAIEWAELQQAKFLGILILMSSSLVERPLTAGWMISVVLGIVGIELICAFLRETTLRSQRFGRLSIAIMALLFMWSLACSLDHIAAYMASTSRFWVISWTVVFNHWLYTAAVIIGSALAIFGLLRVHPKRNERLTKPRYWLWA